MTFRAVRVRAWASLVAVLYALAAHATEPSPREQRKAQRDLDNFLQLSTAQQHALQAQRVTFMQEWQALDGQARALLARTPGGVEPVGLSVLCERAQALQARLRDQGRGVLDAAQADRLAQLEAAFSLMPLIEAAQAAGLMASHLDLPPAGLPGGSATVAFGWGRVPVNTLPGCSTTRVLREVDLDESRKTRSPGSR